MCGIIGFNFEDRLLAQKMCSLLSHRGPDGNGIYSNSKVTLGHTRLKIIDLVTGQQPIYNEDGSIVIVYNGEIYNFRELRSILETKGHQFATNTDTEVIVHAYEEFGIDCLTYFNGMFAFAIYDDRSKLFFLARDRSGIKPLHYTILNDGTFIFASEIKAILEYKRVAPEIDPQSLHHIINLRYIPGNRTMFRGIYRLSPAHYMIVQGKEIKICPYWQPTRENTSKSDDYYFKTCRNLLEESVRRHLISDVPLGIMLSGGIDSSSIVALSSTMVEEPIKTFCMGFGHSNDELEDAQLVADHFETDHYQLIVDDRLLKDYPTMIWYADEPKRNLYPYYISEMVSQHVKTALGGLGSDEIFGGYVFKYNFADRVDSIRKKAIYETKTEIEKIATRLIEFQTKYGNIVEDEHLDYLEMIQAINRNVDLYLITQTQDKVFDKSYLEKMYGEKLLTEKIEPVRNVYEHFFSNNDSFIDQILMADFQEKMINDFLLVDDRMNMAHSVESRVPFLDTKLVDFSLSIPTRLKLQDPNGKHVLKMAMKDILPESVIKKKKQGFASGTYEVYLREGRELAQQTLCNGNLIKEGYIKREYVEKILRAIPNPRLDLHYGVLWNLLVSEIWYGIYIEQDSGPKNLNIDKIIG